MRKYVMVLLSIIVFMIACSHDSPDNNGNNNPPPPPPPPAFSNRILMLGRSVMGGWFSHWGDWQHVTRDGYELFYGEMDSPPEIANSAIRIINQRNVDATWAVFFKFCFVDFDVYSQQEAQQRLNENKALLEQVRQEVRTNKKAYLIIGTALPEVSENSNQHIKWLHQQFNSWVKTLPPTDSRIKVFDLHAFLVDGNGNLRNDYKAGNYDSHLNNKAYNALDQQFFPFLHANVLAYRQVLPVGIR